jgi:hypothetical protein
MPRTRFPHLLSADVPVWERWLAANRDKYDAIEYDVRVGQGRDPGPVVSDKYREMAIDLSRRRIDAVLHSPNQITTVEITTQAGLTALGQCLAYPILYIRTYLPTLAVAPLLVCAEIEPDLRPVYLTLDIPINIA